MDEITAVAPIEFTIEPAEGKSVLYLRVAPRVKGGTRRAMIFFTLRAKNTTGKTLNVKELTVSFPGSSLDPFVFPSRNVEIPANGARSVGLRNGNQDTDTVAEQIGIEGDVFPTKIKITLAVPELPGGVVSETWDLKPHTKSYEFFARPESGDFGEFIQLGHRHFFGGGDQHFGQDANVVGWNKISGKLTNERTDGALNTDMFLFGRPIYAMADGIVLRATYGNVDNPTPSMRSFGAKNPDSEYETAFEVDDVSVVGLSSERMVLATIAKGAGLRLTCLSQDEAGTVLTPLSDSRGSDGERVRVERIDNSRAVTALQQGTKCELTLWSVSKDGKQLTSTGTLTIPGVVDVKLVQMKTVDNTAFLVTVARTTQKTLAIAVLRIGKTGFLSQTPHATATAGTIGIFDVLKLERPDTIDPPSAPSRFTTAVALEDGRMKVIVWELVFEGGEGWGGTGSSGGSVSNCKVVRHGEATTNGAVTEISLSNTGRIDKFATAIGTELGTAKVILWEADAAGQLKRHGSREEPGPASHIHARFFKTSSLLLAFRTGSETLRVAAYEVSDKDPAVPTFARDYEQNRGFTDLIATTRVPTEQATLVTAVRTAAGRAKLILWQFSSSNTISILHGNEVVHFVHLHQNSIPDGLRRDTQGWQSPPYRTVKQGEKIGEMGHSGKSAGPHVHIHIQKVYDELVNDVDKIVETFKADGDVGPFRPMQFRNVQAMKQDNVKPGWKNNSMTLIDGDGAYFDTYVVWPWKGDFPG